MASTNKKVQPTNPNPNNPETQKRKTRDFARNKKEEEIETGKEINNKKRKKLKPGKK